MLPAAATVERVRVLLVAGTGRRGPEDHSSIRGRREEGALVRVPPALDHLVQVLPGQRLRERLGQVAWGHRHQRQ